MPAVAHDLEREINWMPNVFEPGDPAGAKLRALHHAGVQLHHTVKVEARTDAGVEERLVFHEPDRRNHCGQGTAGDSRPTGVACSLDCGFLGVGLSPPAP